MSKKILKEATIRRFMKLAKIDNHLNKDFLRENADLSEDEIEESHDLHELDDIEAEDELDAAEEPVSDEPPVDFDDDDEELELVDDEADEGDLEAKLVAGIEAMAAAMGVDVEVSGGDEEEPMDDEPMDDEPMDDEPMDDLGPEPELAMESLVNRVAARVAKRILNESK